MTAARTPTRAGGHRGHAAILIVALAALALAGAVPARAELATPHAGGDSAADIDLGAAGRWVLTRWVARRTGTLRTLYVHVKTEGSDACPGNGRPGYADGDSGLLRATTHPVLPDGRPDLTVTLSSYQAVPCAAETRGSIAIPLALPVTRGHEYATVVRNVHASPTANYFSQNFLWSRAGIAGANGRNERSASASDAYYGLDPREVVGWSTDAGRTWALPGGPYGGNAGGAFLPTYIQDYGDGETHGQPYYWATPASGTVTMVYPRVPVPWTIRRLGAYASAPGTSTVRLLVDGTERARATLSGSGMLRAAIAPVGVSAGSTVRVTTTAGSGGLGLSRINPDHTWGNIFGLGTAHGWYMEGNGQSAVPLYALPMYGVTTTPPPPPSASRPAPTPDPEPAPAPEPVDPPADARGARAAASSVAGAGYEARRANDGDPTTRWASRALNGQWWRVDLGRRRTVGSVSLHWHTAYASRYLISFSSDGRNWSTLPRIAIGRAGRHTHSFAPRSARFVRVSAVRRATSVGISLKDVVVRAPASRPKPSPFG